MTRLVIFLLAVVALASGLAWLADRPGSLVIDWQGYLVETSVFRAIVILAALTGFAVLVWSILRQIWSSPATVGHYLTRRRQRRGLDALSSGMIAIGAGDRSTATRYAIQARKSLPNEPLTHLLRAQAAQLSGDKATARRIFEAMLASPDTEQLGLRGLFLEAGREGEREVQRQFAERAIGLNPKLAWPVEALFELQCKAGDWAAALDTLSTGRKHGHLEKGETDRRRAVLLTAQAQSLEEANAEKALSLALEAHGLAPDLVPAAAIAGRLLASRGNTARAAKIIQKTWAKAPHPDLATAYAYARIGDSPRDRLDRIKQLAMLNPMSAESSIAIANAAIEARDYGEARSAVAPLLDGRLTRRVATLMARIEGEDQGDKGRVREWLARAVTAPRDPAWTADGVISDRWAPASPVTGALDAFSWKVPVEDLRPEDGDMLAEKFEGLVALATAVDDKETPVSVTDPGPAKSKAATSVTRPAAPEIVDVDEADAEETEFEDDGDGAVAVELPPAPSNRPVARTAPVNVPSVATAAVAVASAVTTKKVRESAVEIKETPAVAAKAQTIDRKRKGETQRGAERRVFVPPRAPDDPGTEMADEEEPDPPLERPYRATN